jgi:geranylgeranyl diphosphate synthase, type II
MGDDNDLIARMRQLAAEVDAGLGRFLSRQAAVPDRLMQAIRYSLDAGGKRLRPALVLEWHDLLAGPTASSRASALAAAGAIELIHTFSLVHDDLPAMDDDDLRRGRPTNHKVFGEAMAILAGDAMTTLAFQLLADDADAGVSSTLVSELARASGPAGMIGGQVIDIDSENQSLALAQLRQLHAMKTGALLVCACRMGAICAGASAEELTAATKFGKHLGLAFQIMDDVLDVTSTPESMGKATNKDAVAGKNTYPKLLGLEASRSMAENELKAALQTIPPDAKTLDALARFVVERKS